jgi:prevent-host-death family protein
MGRMVSTYEAKAHLSKIIAEVAETGEPVTICRHNSPIVDVVVHRGERDPLRQDPTLQGAVFRGDPCAPVDEADWPEALR